jgi:glycerate 2-kinase
VSKTILLAPNAFKESADSLTVSSIITEVIKSETTYNVIEKPLSDGGDGFLNVCEKIFNTNRLSYYIQRIYDNQLIPFELLYSEEKRIVYIESAEIVGLKKIPVGLRKPLHFSTRNIGNLLQQLSKDINSQDLKVEKVVIGVGGTATVDFGLGLASAFGVKVLDEDDNELEVIPSNYLKIKKIITSKISLPFRVEAIVDVKTPLFGPNNAINMYSKQKNATDDQIKYLIKGFSNIYNILKNNNLIEFDKILNGSGGGLAAGLEIFLNARLIPAETFIENEIFGNAILSEIGAVITGEGAFDKQSLENKGAYIVIKKFKDFDIPIYLICGKFDESVKKYLPKNVIIIEIQKFFGSRKDSIKNYKTGLKLAVNEIINHLKN